MTSKLLAPEKIISLILFLIPIIGGAYTANQRLAQLEAKVEALSQDLNGFARKDLVDLQDRHIRDTLELILEELKELRRRSSKERN